MENFQLWDVCESAVTLKIIHFTHQGIHRKLSMNCYFDILSPNCKNEGTPEFFSQKTIRSPETEVV